MLLYNELGRHTPPPPPYSPCKCNTANTGSANEASQQLAPPPPPPYLSSTTKVKCTIPSIDYLWRQTAASDDTYFFRNGNSILLPPVPPERSSTQVFNSEQSGEDSPARWKYDWSFSEAPAHPVEPKWTPVGVLGYLGPPFGGDRPPRPKIQLHRLSHITSRSYDFGVGARIKPDHENLIVQSPSTAASGRSVASCAIQSPVPTLATVTTMDQKPLHTFGRQLSKDSASYASIITNEAPPSIEPSKTMYASSAVPTSQKLNGVNDASNVKSLKATNEKSSMIEEPNDIGSVSDKDDDFFHAAMIPKSQVQTSSAGSKHEPRPFKDSWTSQGQHRGHLISHCSRRKTSSSSARFAPYERRQSNASEKTKQRVGGAVDNKYVKPPEIRDDMRMGGNDEGNERKLETTLVEVEKE